jgi:hypothetical protein
MKAKRKNGKKANPKALAQTAKQVIPSEAQQDDNADPLKPLWTSEKYELLIDSLNIDAANKDRLKQVLKLTIKIAERVVEVGKKIIEIIVWALKKYPRTAMAAFIGAILTLVALHIPLISVVLGPIIATMALGATALVFTDESIKNHILTTFSPLTPRN